MNNFENKNQYKLFLSMIVADFESPLMLKRAIDYLIDYVDGLYITVTYKKEKPKKNHPLVELIHSYKTDEKFVEVSFFKWVEDFSIARNFAMDQVPKGKNVYLFWVDTDDVVMSPELIPDVMNTVVSQGIKAVYFPYWYQVELDSQGDVRQILTEQKRERIILNDGTFKWIGSLHETLIDQGKENRKKVLLKEPVVVHLTNNDRFDVSIKRNLAILESTHKKEGGKDPRTTMYLAKTYYDLAKQSYGVDEKIFKEYADKAVSHFGVYLEGKGDPGSDSYITPSGWPEERSTAWQYLAELSVLVGDLESAESSLKYAIDESEKFPNYYVDLAHVYIRMGKWDKAKHYLTIGTNLPEPKTTIITNPRDSKLRAYEATAKIALNEKNFEVAKKAFEEMSILLPEDESLVSRIRAIDSLMMFNKACQSAVFLGKYLEMVGEQSKIPYLIQSFSNDMQQEKFAAEMRMLFYPPRTWAQNEITIFAGPGFEEWSPDSLSTGLGGSEEAIVYLAKELYHIGWRVTVYANPGEKAGTFDGVDYKMWYEFNPNDNFNVLVLWRGISFIDMNPKAKFIALWNHDVPNVSDFTKERLDKIDKLIVLSEYHKSLFLMNENGEFKPIPENKFWLSSNGIIPLTPNQERKKNSLIYASSPDRGLVYLLNNWEKIKKEIPDLTLDIYYGFAVFDAIHRNNPERMAWKKKILELMDQDGITHHGRVGHSELHDAYARADVWVYPTDFSEISCISGQKAQALGAIPFVTDFAALSETVKFGARVDVDIKTKDGQEEFFNEFIKFMKSSDREKLREQMMKFSQDYFLWSKVAQEWSNVFNNHIRR